MAIKKASVILVGGGTGGHIMPLIALGEELRARKIPFLYVGGKKSREQELVGDLKWPFVPIQAGKWRRYLNFASFFENIADIFRVIIGFFQCIGILGASGAKVVFSKGGYVSLPMVYAARIMGRRLIIHESDAYMGRTNRIASKFADKTLTAFETSVYPNHDSRFVQVGIPIRKELRTAAHLKSPAKVRPLVLVLGGIQGAMAINNFLADSLSEILKVADVVHSTGPVEVKKFEKLRDELPEKVRSQYRPFGFIGRELPYYYQLADLIVSRASATTVAEAATFSKPVYLIPLPTSAGDHQNINAQKLSEVNAAEVRNQADLSGKQFAKDVGNLLNNHDKLAELGQNLKKYFNEEKSVDECVEIITSYLPKENNGH